MFLFKMLTEVHITLIHEVSSRAVDDKFLVHSKELQHLETAFLASVLVSHMVNSFIE